MKKIITGSLAYEKMTNAINLLCDTVKVTLGPKGRNVIIDTNYMNPFITNDGVTIAKEVASEDLFENVILNIAKEASIKTNDEVGDGTTTSLVLLQSIFNEGIKLINDGVNPIILKKEMDESLIKIIGEINKLKIKVGLKDIKSIASISSNSQEIGDLISNVYQKIGLNGLITIDESSNNQTRFEIVEGLEFDSELISNYMLKNTLEDKLKDSYILISNAKINNIGEINNLLNEVIDSNKSLLIICDNMSDNVTETLTLNRHQNVLDVIGVSLLNYGDNKNKLLEDVAIFTGGKFINTHVGFKINEVTIEDLGNAKEIKINKEKTIIINGNGSKNEISLRKKEIKNEIGITNSFNREFFERRLASLNKGVAIIYVGANSKTEMIEEKMRIIDALSSTKVALAEGALIGGGVSFLKVRASLLNDNNSLGMKIILEALKQPFLEIINNLGLDAEEIFNYLKLKNYQIGFNALTEQYVDMNEEKIIDPVKVVINALINATSIAGMLLTTKTIIADDNLKEEIDVDQIC